VGWVVGLDAGAEVVGGGVAGWVAGAERVSVGVGEVVRLGICRWSPNIVAVVVGECRCLGTGEWVAGVGWLWLADAPPTLTPTAPVSPPAAALASASTSVVRRWRPP